MYRLIYSVEYWIVNKKFSTEKLYIRLFGLGQEMFLINTKIKIKPVKCMSFCTHF